MIEKNTVHCMDVIDFLKKLQENNILVDGTVTDAPYGLEFMGKEWDTFKTGRTKDYKPPEIKKVSIEGNGFKQLPQLKKDVNPKCKKCGHYKFSGTPCKCEVPEWELDLSFQNSFQQWCYSWSKELIKVMKPGAYACVFGGVRTHHRLTIALEDSGFIIRDMLIWGYASGMPKSYNISLGFDKQAFTEQFKKEHNRKPTKEEFKDGFKKFRKPIGKPSQLPSGKWGKESDTYDFGYEKDWEITEPKTELAKKWEGFGTALKPAFEPIILVQKPLEKNYCHNVEKHSVGGLNIDGSRIHYTNKKDKDQMRRGVVFDGNDQPPTEWNIKSGFKTYNSSEYFNDKGRFPSNILLTEPILDMKSKEVVKSRDNPATGHAPPWKVTGYGNFGGGKTELDETKIDIQLTDKGGYSKFFLIPKPSSSEKDAFTGSNTFNRKCKKCGKWEIHSSGKWGEFHKKYACQCEKPELEEASTHPTVKPKELIKHLINLIIPYKINPNAVVLDCFVGSGTTGIVCKEMGINFYACDNEQEYVDISLMRLEKTPKQEMLFRFIENETN